MTLQQFKDAAKLLQERGDKVRDEVLIHTEQMLRSMEECGMWDDARKLRSCFAELSEIEREAKKLLRESGAMTHERLAVAGAGS